MFLFQFTHPGGVRPPLSFIFTDPPRFQFTHPGGVRLERTLLMALTLRFQFTHPGGVRRFEANDFGRLASFNSRTREGCDISHELGLRSACGFNSRTREGCDVVARYVFDYVPLFQFTHPGGVRRAKGRASRHSRGFNSRTREGCDVALQF